MGPQKRTTNPFSRRKSLKCGRLWRSDFCRPCPSGPFRGPGRAEVVDPSMMAGDFLFLKARRRGPRRKRPVEHRSAEKPGGPGPGRVMRRFDGPEGQRRRRERNRLVAGPRSIRATSRCHMICVENHGPRDLRAPKTNNTPVFSSEVPKISEVVAERFLSTYPILEGPTLVDRSSPRR